MIRFAWTLQLQTCWWEYRYAATHSMLTLAFLNFITCVFVGFRILERLRCKCNDVCVCAHGYFSWFSFQIAKKNARCDYALFVGGTEKNFNEIPELSSLVAGLKLYLNDTFTTLKMNDSSVWAKVFCPKIFIQAATQGTLEHWSVQDCQQRFCFVLNISKYW